MQRLKRAFHRTLEFTGLELRRIQRHSPPPPPEGINILALAISDLLLRYAREGKEASAFTCVQIGANDGLSYDPLRHFILKYRFRAYLVEPQPDAFRRLQINYREHEHVQVANVAIAKENGSATLYCFRKGPGLPYWADCIATFSKELLLNNGFGFTSEIEELQIPAITLDTLFERSGFAGIDLLQIDAEGYDYEILKMLESSRVRPAIINFEHAFLSAADRNECGHYLNRMGYKVTDNGADSVAYLEPEEQAETFTRAPAAEAGPAAAPAHGTPGRIQSPETSAHS